MVFSNLVKLYDQASIEDCPWPANRSGDMAKQLLEPLVRHGISHFVNNINAKMAVLLVDDLVIPITINEFTSNNSFVTSPYSQYVSYAYVIEKKINNPLVRHSFKFLLNFYSSLMRFGDLDKVVIVNNWLLTTNPYPKLDKKKIQSIGEFLKSRFPQHAIVFRSIVSQTCKDCYLALKENRYQFIASKYVYITDGSDEEVFKTRIFKSDLNFLKKSPFKLVPSAEIQAEEANHLYQLYKNLYIDKHSSVNPHYNSNFFQLLLKSKALNLLIVKQEQNFEGIAAYFCSDGKMISPFVGYNLIDAEKKGIYRYLSTTLLLEAQRQAALFNQSAGGSFYKQIRRAKGSMEYTAVDDSHLPFYRRLPWRVLRFFINTIGSSLMKKY